MGYNQHQSFYLRDRWLGKALRQIEKDTGFFFRDDAFERIGLGKNMVQSLRHWVKATNVVEENSREKKQEFTTFGKVIREYDVMIKHFGTAALLHYMITKEDEPSTAWYWFFNEYEGTKTTREELFHEFVPWVQSRETRVVSENSLKRDIDCLVNMYISGGDSDDPEEVTLSPLYRLGLVREQYNTIYKEELVLPEDHESRLFLLYVLLDYAQKHEQEEISIEEILNEPGLLGRVFNLTRSTILQLLSEWEESEYDIVFRRTNNLDVVRVPSIDPNEFLKEQYEKLEVKMNELKQF